MVVIVDFDDEELDRFHGKEAHHILDVKANARHDITEPLNKPAERRLFQNVVTEAFAQYP